MPIINVYTLACFLFVSRTAALIGIPEDAFKTVPQLIDKYGYQSETHYVTTDDGYILTVFRMQSKDRPQIERQPILLVHGLIGSSADFLLSGPGKALAYELADHDFDVWLINTRGTRYSTNHTHIPAWDSRFWNFSWHENGIFDVPNTIDYILSLSIFEQIIHIGMSQGTTSFYVKVSERPEYNNKVKAHISYAPSAFLCHTTNMLLKVAASPEYNLTYSTLAQRIGHFDMLPHIHALPFILKTVCQSGNEISSICLVISKMLVNFHIERLEASHLLMMVGHLPAGGSSKQLIHYAQLINNCGFRPYQTGAELPMSYNVSNIKVPIYAFYGDEDVTQSPENVRTFERALQNTYNKFILVKGYGHSDFMVSPDAKFKVYKPTIDILKQLP